MTEQFKTCSKCGEVKAVEMFLRRGLWCKACAAIYARDHREKNRDAYRSHYKKSNKKNNESRTIRHREYVEKNKEKIASHRTAYQARNREKIKQQKNLLRQSLSDGYVREIIVSAAGSLRCEIPEQLIEVKRKHLQILRKLKEATNDNS